MSGFVTASRFSIVGGDCKRLQSPLLINKNKDERMLVLSRKLKEKIMLGEDIVIEVIDIRGDKVRLGIHAPGDLPVHREEVFLAIKRANEPDEPRTAAHN